MGKINHFNLNDIKSKYQIETFIETGFGNGDGLLYASQTNFNKIYSIEIMQCQIEMFGHAFKEDSRVQLLCGNTIEILQKLLPQIKNNICFWLDAHFPGADNPSPLQGQHDAEKNDDIRLPLEKELEIIKDLRKNYKDVILIDDIKLYMNNGEFANWVPNIKPRQKFSSKEFYKEILSDTHHFDYFNNDTGYGVLTPL
jgi:hypothetical protein